MTKEPQEHNFAAGRHAAADGVPLPTHVEEAIQAIAAMHAAHREEASWLDRLIDGITAAVARASFLFCVAAVLVLWVLSNALSQRSGLGAFDALPFPLLALCVSCAALFIAILILASQRRADRLANLREQMTLETVLLNTQKASKLIDLMEEFRRDSPNVKDRVDLEAMEMSGMPNHETVLNAIQEINDNLPPER
jgi:uncharacterized membrane protein